MSQTTTPAPSLVLTVPEAAEALRVSRSTVYGLIRDAALPTCRVGTKLRVPRAALEAWVAARVEVATPAPAA